MILLFINLFHVMKLVLERTIGVGFLFLCFSLFFLILEQFWCFNLFSFDYFLTILTNGPWISRFAFHQGGKFDHADRLFQSIEGTYQNCLSNTSDVKELIPEFFYMPEFLVNSNSYHFGVRQDGEPIADVCLPPWAKVCEHNLI